MTETLRSYKTAERPDVAGSIGLVIESQGHRSGPTQTHNTGVFRLLQPLYLDDSGQVLYIIVSYGGAYFSEKYAIDVTAQEGAHLLLSTQGATRIHRTVSEPSVQEMVIRLGPGSRVEYIPDRTIAYKDSSYLQETEIWADPTAQGFFGDIITSGWDPENKRFTYSDLHLRTTVRPAADEGYVLIDNLRLRPARIGEAIEDLGHLEGFSHMGSFLILGAHLDEAYADRVREITAAYDRARAGTTRGNRHGVSWLMVRALANSTKELNDMLLDINELDREITGTGQSRLDLRRY